MAHMKAVLLDIDGTLVDSNHAHAQAWLEVFAESGRDVPYDEVRTLIGKGGDKLLPEAIGIPKDSPEGTRLAQRRTKLFLEKYLPALRAFPRTRELLERLRETGARLVVATSAQEDEMNGLLKIARADDLVDETTSSSDAKDSKPDPDIVAAALSRAGCAPDEALMLGDTPYDVEAATRAGVRIIALRSGGWDDDALRGALAVYEDPADLLVHFDDTPLAD